MLYPPAHICRSLAQLHRQARLGYDPELGAFALIQLYQRRDYANTYRDRWPTEYPIFSRGGRTTHDWDPWSRVPIYLIDVSPRAVESGRLLAQVRRWVRPIASRVYEDAEECGASFDAKITEMGREMGDELYHASMGTGGHGAPIVAKRHIEEDPVLRRMRAGELDLSSQHLPPAPPGGWGKHLEADEGDAGDLGEVSSV